MGAECSGRLMCGVWLTALSAVLIGSSKIAAIAACASHAFASFAKRQTQLVLSAPCVVACRAWCIVRTTQVDACSPQCSRFRTYRSFDLLSLMRTQIQGVRNDLFIDRVPVFKVRNGAERDQKYISC